MSHASVHPRAEEQARGLLLAVTHMLALRSQMPLRCLQAFLAVAVVPGRSVGYYANRCGLSMSTMSRNLLDLGERDRSGDPGLELVWSRDNPNEHRERQYFLTQQGRELLHKILNELT